MTRPFVLDPAWGPLLRGLGVRLADLLRGAGLPEDLFARERPTVSPEGFTKLFGALAKAVGDEAPGLVLGRAEAPLAFSPALFAAYCSPDLTLASKRLAQCKSLTGPLKLEAHAMAGGLELTFEADPGVRLPDEFVASELVFLVHLARQATGHRVRPIAVEMARPPRSRGYAEFFGHPVLEGPFNRVVFDPRDARRPFLSPDPVLFQRFDADLRPRLDQLLPGATLADRTRSALMEALPAGQPEVGVVAKRLGMSARTLQRKLGAEGTSFQDVLRDLRERLARDYLAHTAAASPEVAFLLGYDDPNSFTRAFHTWTGTTPEAFRRQG